MNKLKLKTQKKRWASTIKRWPEKAACLSHKPRT